MRWASPSTVVVKLGETITVTRRGIGIDDEIRYTVAADRQYARGPQFGLKPKRGTFYAVNATIELVKGSAYAGPCDFALVGPDGSVYEADAGFGFDRTLDGARLTPGQKTAGLVVFDVPAAALAGGRIQLRPDLWSDGNDGYWQL